MIVNETLVPSTETEWKEYYHRQYARADKELHNVALLLPHLVRLAMAGEKKDVLQIARRLAGALHNPRDKDPLVVEIRKHGEYVGSVLREE